MPFRNLFKRSPKSEETELVADDSDSVVMSGGTTMGDSARAPGPTAFQSVNDDPVLAPVDDQVVANKTDNDRGTGSGSPSTAGRVNDDPTIQNSAVGSNIEARAQTNQAGEPDAQSIVGGGHTWPDPSRNVTGTPGDFDTGEQRLGGPDTTTRINRDGTQVPDSASELDKTLPDAQVYSGGDLGGSIDYVGAEPDQPGAPDANVDLNTTFRATSLSDGGVSGSTLLQNTPLGEVSQGPQAVRNTSPLEPDADEVSDDPIGTDI